MWGGGGGGGGSEPRTGIIYMYRWICVVFNIMIVWDIMKIYGKL